MALNKLRTLSKASPKMHLFRFFPIGFREMCGVSVAAVEPPQYMHANKTVQHIEIKPKWRKRRRRKSTRHIQQINIVLGKWKRIHKILWRSDWCFVCVCVCVRFMHVNSIWLTAQNHYLLSNCRMVSFFSYFLHQVVACKSFSEYLLKPNELKFNWGLLFTFRKRKHQQHRQQHQ